MSRSTEELVRAALTARAEQVTSADLTQQMAPPATSPRRWAVPLAAAATVAAVVVGVWLVTAPGADRAAPPAESPNASTEVTTAPEPAPTTSSPAPPPTTVKAPPPSASSPKAPTTRRVTLGALSFDVPVYWKPPGEYWEGDTECIGPAADPCSGVMARAAGDSVTVEDYFSDGTCRRAGPTRVDLDHLSATRGDYDCGDTRYLWVLNPDPFYSVVVMTETLSQEQLAVVESVRLAR